MPSLPSSYVARGRHRFVMSHSVEVAEGGYDRLLLIGSKLGKERERYDFASGPFGDR